ncbi:PucR family transcriptional regulator [Nocardioides sp.]|uniref:PucR family transcriptional regulator n=1 Tax=Nocardioides sp. TaxID=35761 RepID=UPI00261E424E|nr:PucR family transcriptional regulator [Nocardioides sp.]MDI6908578.1 helix-turn-helix domain-containing protein [Nocardioides sp.]
MPSLSSNSLRSRQNGFLPELDEVVDMLGPHMLSFVHRPAFNDPVHDVALFDPEVRTQVEHGELIVGAGATAATVLDLIDQAASGRACGVVLREGNARLEAVREQARSRGIALIACPAEVPWAHLVVLIRRVLDGEFREPVESAGPHPEDLFAMADEAAQLLGAPVTIEDNKSRLLAYSAGQEETDPTRLATIVGRRVPPRVLAHYRARGVFKKLVGSDRPFLIEDGPNGTMPRLVVPIHHRGQWLGAIWAVLSERSMPPDLERLSWILESLSTTLLRIQSHLEVERRQLEACLVSLLTHGPGRVPSALGPGPWRAVRVHDNEDGADRQAFEADNLCSGLLLHARRAGWQTPLITTVNQQVYVLVQARGAEPGSWDWLRRLVLETASIGSLVLLAGGVSRTSETIAGSRTEADELADLLRDRPSLASSVTFEDEWARLYLARALKVMTEHDVPGPVWELQLHDDQFGTEYVRTLEAWLSYQTDLRRAAKELHVHPNTIRHRMKRIADIVDIDLEDPEQVLAIRLQAQAIRSGSPAATAAQLERLADSRRSSSTTPARSAAVSSSQTTRSPA